MEVMRPINDVLDVAALQKMQDNFSKATNMSFITVDFKGNPITKASGFTEFCSLCREIPEMTKLCYQCDAHGGLHSAITGKPHIYKCHAGLIDFAIPLMYEGNYYGALMGGQINSNSSEGQVLDRIIEKTSFWPEGTSLSRAYNRTEVIPLEKIQAVVELLHDNVNHILMRKHFENISVILTKTEEELSKERIKVLELQKIIDEKGKKINLPLPAASSTFSELDLKSSISYVEQSNLGDKKGSSEVNKGLTELKKALKEGQYKKCVSSIRKFIDNIFDKNDEIVISNLLSEFASGITDLAKKYKLPFSGLSCLENVISKLTFDKETYRYKGYSLLIDMMNSLFDDLYHNHIYNDEITKASNYIDRNIKAFLTLEQVADFINMSPSYFSKQFKKTFNKTFNCYITEEKINLAKYMLTYSNIPVINISYELSFRETNYFSKVFKKVVGKTPTEYREESKT